MQLPDYVFKMFPKNSVPKIEAIEQDSGNAKNPLDY